MYMYMYIMTCILFRVLIIHPNEPIFINCICISSLQNWSRIKLVNIRWGILYMLSVVGEHWKRQNEHQWCRVCVGAIWKGRLTCVWWAWAHKYNLIRIQIVYSIEQKCLSQKYFCYTTIFIEMFAFLSLSFCPTGELCEIPQEFTFGTIGQITIEKSAWMWIAGGHTTIHHQTIGHWEVI